MARAPKLGWRLEPTFAPLSSVHFMLPYTTHPTLCSPAGHVRDQRVRRCHVAPQRQRAVPRAVPGPHNLLVHIRAAAGGASREYLEGDGWHMCCWCVRDRQRPTHRADVLPDNACEGEGWGARGVTVVSGLPCPTRTHTPACPRPRP